MLMVAAAVASYFIKTPFVFPAILIVAGCITAFNYKAHPREPKKKFNVVWANLVLWVGVLIFAAVLGSLTKSRPEFLPIRLFENFYPGEAGPDAGATPPSTRSSYVLGVRKQPRGVSRPRP